MFSKIIIKYSAEPLNDQERIYQIQQILSFRQKSTVYNHRIIN